MSLLGVIGLLASARIGVATTFGSPAHDPWNPRPLLACRLAGEHRRRDLDERRDFVVAHPTLPCRSRVLLLNLRTGRAAVAVVGDRGPRAALVDLAPRVARALHANGFERVVLIPLSGGS